MPSPDAAAAGVVALVTLPAAGSERTKVEDRKLGPARRAECQNAQRERQCYARCTASTVTTQLDQSRQGVGGPWGLPAVAVSTLSYGCCTVQCPRTRPCLLQQPRKHGQRIYLTCIVPPDPTATPRRTSQHRRRPSQNTPPSHPPTTHNAPPFAAALRSAVAPAKHRPPCLSGP